MADVHKSSEEKVWQVNVENISNASVATRYYDWIVELFSKYLGQRTLEVGAGVGTISRRLVKFSNELVISDVSEECLDIIKKGFIESRLSPSGMVEYVNFLLGDTPPLSFSDNPFDSIVCMNVLEHIEDDVGALSNLKSALKKDGNLIIFVPAFPQIYGSADKALGHFRRYRKEALRYTLEKAGYQVKYIKYINFLGFFGWWWNSCVQRKEVISVGHFRLFNYLFPVVKFIESRITLPFGVSLLAVTTRCCYSAGGRCSPRFYGPVKM